MPATTIPQLFDACVEQGGDAWALREFDAGSGGLVETLSWRAWRDRSRDLAAALVGEGEGGGRGRALAILAGNTSTWPLAELAGVLAGMVTVGIYPTASVPQVRELLLDCGATVVVVDTPMQLARVRDATVDWATPLLVVARVSPAGLRADGPLTPVREVTWDAFAAGGAARRRDRAFAERLQHRADVAGGEEIAMLVYTSGSTGRAKGARLSHRYVLESARSVRDALGLTRADSSLSFLPFSHAGERIFGLYTRITCGMPATLVRDGAALWEAGVAAEPTLFGGMPRDFEKVYEGLQATRRAARPEVAAQWDEALEAGRQRAELRASGERVPPHLADRWHRNRDVLASAVARYFGARLRLATSGGAALPREVATYLDACGVTVLGAYGQTEHLCATFNRPECHRLDSVGVAMPGTTLRIADDGEVQLLRSALTFSGYHERPDETAAAFTSDGRWLRTGDLGSVDANGFLRLTGRLKELIALSNGKKVAPLPLEARLAANEWVAHAVVHGEGRPYLVALLVPRWERVRAWQEATDVEGDAASLVEHAGLRSALAAVVDAANREVSPPEQVKRFAVLPTALTVDGGDLTPTHKLRRAVVTARFRHLLDALYEEPG